MGFIDQHRWDDPNFWWGDAATATAADPQLQFFENFPGHLGAGFVAWSQNTASFHAVNIPLSLSFNQVAALVIVPQFGAGDESVTYQFGLYSLNGSTLSMANSASRLYTTLDDVTATSWMSFATSATQNITPGTWYFGFKVSSANGNNPGSMYANSSINPANAIPEGFLRGRMTASTNAMPGSIATSDLDITGSDAIRQPYIIITA